MFKKSMCYFHASFLRRVISLVLPEYDLSSVGEEEHFEMRHLWSALLDWQVRSHIGIIQMYLMPAYTDLAAHFGVYVGSRPWCVVLPIRMPPTDDGLCIVYGITLFLP